MIDLQSHSTVSDGQLEPGDVARSAAEAGVTVMSLTDHDGVAGVDEATRVATELGIENVPATEMSCVHKYSEDLHICGYWVDLEKIAAGLRQGPAGARRPRQGDHRQPQPPRGGGHVRGRGRQGRAPPTRSAARTSPRRPAPGPTSGRSSRSTWSRGRRRSSSRKWPSAEQAVELIHEAGGVAVVAHPYWDVKDPDQVRDLVESLVRDVGLDGIETFYPPHTAEQTKHCLELCEEFGLVPTASSDFHGPTHKTFSRWGAYDTYGLGEPQVPARP